MNTTPNQEQVQKYAIAIWAAVQQAAPRAGGRAAVETSLVVQAASMVLASMLAGHPQINEGNNLDKMAERFGKRLRQDIRFAIKARADGNVRPFETSTRPAQTN